MIRGSKFGFWRIRLIDKQGRGNARQAQEDAREAGSDSALHRVAATRMGGCFPPTVPTLLSASYAPTLALLPSFSPTITTSTTTARAFSM